MIPKYLFLTKGVGKHKEYLQSFELALRDAGMEVIYTGLRQTPEQIVETALQEDVNVIGLSILSGAHMTLFPRIIDLIKKKKLDDVLVFAGGIIPGDDVPALKRIGIAEVFGPGTTTDTLVRFVRENVWKKK
jgi:methylmalonyl-CoA mutase C-terminal domain/subunit